MFEDLFKAIEDAIDEHSQLLRVEPYPGWFYEPQITVNRQGATASIVVKLRKSRKNPTEISANGDTPIEATQELIRTLDYWAQAMK